MSKPTPYCKDCRFHHLELSNMRWSCLKFVEEVDVVTGYHTFISAQTARRLDQYCGMDGNLFEPCFTLRELKAKIVSFFDRKII